MYSGREGMVEFWTSFIEEPWALFELEIEALEETGDGRVLALLTFNGTDRESGHEVHKPYAHLVAFRGDEVIRIDAFDDWDAAREAAGGG
jgi:ketosteroid isomerase-like protein